MHSNDLGPIYAETPLSSFPSFPVEPWNTASNFIFLAIIIYWGLKSGGDVRRFPFLIAALPILAIGFVGGTLFHATRSRHLWLILDYTPILILASATAIYFWKRISGSGFLAVILVLLPLCILRGAWQISDLPRGALIAIGYFTTAATVLLPAFIYSTRHRRELLSRLLYATVFFACALTFRQLDAGSSLAMGTHWLWHLFGGVSVFYLFSYIYEDERQVRT